jgi:hypothetical protein
VVIVRGEATLVVGRPSSRMIAMTAPTGTLSPGLVMSRSMMPVVWDSTSMAAFSVSTSAMISPLVMRSPSFFFHCTKMPSVMSAPSVGIRNSAMMETP